MWYNKIIKVLNVPFLFQLSAQCGGELDFGGSGLGGFSDENGVPYFRIDGEVSSLHFISLRV